MCGWDSRATSPWEGKICLVNAWEKMLYHWKSTVRKCLYVNKRMGGRLRICESIWEEFARLTKELVLFWGKERGYFISRYRKSMSVPLLASLGHYNHWLNVQEATLERHNSPPTLRKVKTCVKWFFEHLENWQSSTLHHINSFPRSKVSAKER